MLRTNQAVVRLNLKDQCVVGLAWEWGHGSAMPKVKYLDFCATKPLVTMVDKGYLINGYRKFMLNKVILVLDRFVMRTCYVVLAPDNSYKIRNMVNDTNLDAFYYYHNNSGYESVSGEITYDAPPNMKLYRSRVGGKLRFKFYPRCKNYIENSASNRALDVTTMCSHMGGKTSDKNNVIFMPYITSAEVPVKLGDTDWICKFIDMRVRVYWYFTFAGRDADGPVEYQSTLCTSMIHTAQ